MRLLWLSMPLAIGSCTNGSNALGIPPSAEAPGSVAPSSPPAVEASSVAAPRLAPIPAAYGSPALVEADRIRVAGWKLKQGDAHGAQQPGYNDAGWKSVELPGTVPVSTPAKHNTIWLRATVELPASVDPRALAIDLGARAGHSTAWVNGEQVDKPPMRNAPLFLHAPLPLRTGTNTIAIKLVAGSHIGGVRWSGEAAIGREHVRHWGMVTRELSGQRPLGVYIPRAANLANKSPLVVALPGWDGNVFSFAHSGLLTEAERRGWIVLVPDPGGNVLYTGESEAAVLRAIELVKSELNVDPDRIYLTGVSMGGAGALQIGYHYPDKFAAITAFYGDSRYEPKGYVRGILRDQETADRYSVLLFHRNARNTPVLLVHARDDRVSAFAQSEQLARADAEAGFRDHKLVAPSTGGHSLQVVEDAVPEMAALFEGSRRAKSPARVTFTTNHRAYGSAWWLRVQPRGKGRFGTADVTLAPRSNEILVHALDDGLDEATVDLAEAGYDRLAPITVIVESPTRASLRIDGKTLPPSAPGRYTLSL